MQFSAKKVILLITVIIFSQVLSSTSFATTSHPRPTTINNDSFKNNAFLNDYAQGNNNIPQDRYYVAGDPNDNNGIWMRPFYEGGKQNNWGDLLGHRFNTFGIVFGFDIIPTENLILGLAVSYATTKSKSINFYDTHTSINTRLAIFYGTYEFPKDTYLDWIFSGGQIFNHGQRTTADSSFIRNFSFSGKQFSFAAILSKDYCYNKITFSPEIDAIYVYLNQNAYSEYINDTRDTTVPFYDANVFTIGAGVSGTKTIKWCRNSFIPEAKALLYYDIVSSKLNSASAFILGGPALSTSATPGRLTGQIGASLTLNIIENFILKIEYDLQLKVKYFNNIAYINVKYLF